VIAGLQAAVDAARAHVETHFSGNCYYGLSNLLGQLRDLTPPGVSGEPLAPVSDLAGALASLRQEVGKLGGMALEEGQRLMSALEAMIEPSPAAIEHPAPADIEPAAALRTPAPESAEAEPVSAGEAVAVPQESAEEESEDDAGPRTGFDELAELSWRRVQQVTEMDHQASHGLNGATAPVSAHSAPEHEAAQEQAPAPAFAQPVAEPQPELEPEHAPASAQAFELETAAMATPTPLHAAAEPPQEPDAPDAMARDIAEALNDGGSESRSSEPCYAAEFELSPPQPASRPDPEPAGETAAEQTPETAGQDAQPAESPCLTGELETAEATPESAPESGAAPAEPLAAGAEAETGIPPEAVTAPEAVPVETVAVASEPAEAAGAAPQAEAGLEAAAPDQDAAEAVSASAEETQAPAAKDAAPPEIIIESEAAARTPEPEPEQMPKPERKGFFSRLFGGRAAEHR
jgi:hypothetical protein